MRRMSNDRGSDGPMVTARGLKKSYRLHAMKVPVLRGVDVSVTRGEFVAIMGPSGCGKTTLLNCLSGLDESDEGTIMLDGKDLATMGDRARTRFRAEKMGFVFQAFNLIPVLTAVQNVEMPLLLRGASRAEARDRALEALAQVGLSDRADHKPTELSGGQQQRVAIARALVNKPAVIWADEPTGNLDQEATEAVLDLLRGLNRHQGVTLVVVTHDTDVAKAAHRIVRMRDGRIVDGRSVAEAAPTVPAPSPTNGHKKARVVPPAKVTFR